MPKFLTWVLMGCAVAILSAMAWTWRGKKPGPTQGASDLDPNSLLFTLPTICDQGPETVPNSIPGNAEAFHINEDDWRQVEFIVARDLAQVEGEMAAIEEFKHANRVGLGWKSVYVRKERPDGLFPSHLPYGLIDSIAHCICCCSSSRLRRQCSLQRHPCEQGSWPLSRIQCPTSGFRSKATAQAKNVT